MDANGYVLQGDCFLGGPPNLMGKIKVGIREINKSYERNSEKAFILQFARSIIIINVGSKYLKDNEDGEDMDKHLLIMYEGEYYESKGIREYNFIL